ncbi:type VII secretion-associated protein [Mycolicibacterium sp. YH-1]|uniref:type VII secretion-associated protein n=1 Tax=Mycolicibacterium sp. YH-1 TaxID=2908837 RepID=UPI001F4C126C|nr:type VII secretion-associated protein [Mycolicibacterium sp. YH-1]UNB51288.1 type VII secretion-associated protein [Mycolicibacterium sp. YH-1]
MSSAPAVVLVGPATTRGPSDVPADLDAEALACVDDDLALIDDRVVSVNALWSEVLRHAVGEHTDAVLLICPSWWTATRIRRVATAAEGTCRDVCVVRRGDALHASAVHAVVEIAPELIAISPPGSSMRLVPRVGDRGDVVNAAISRLRHVDRVVIDPSTEVDVADLDDIARELRGRGALVTVTDDAAVIAAAVLEHQRRSPGERRWLRRCLQPRVVIAAGVAMSVSVLSALGARYDAESPGDGGLTWLVEGRVALEVPADWSTERVVVGPGSARVQVVSPTDPIQAIHVTQSPIPRGQSLEAAAAVVRTALGQQPDGVFGDFDPAARVEDEPAITYRETRSDRVVDWTLVLEGGVRIAIGCQGAPGGATPDAECGRAIRSAHEWE